MAQTNGTGVLVSRGIRIIATVLLGAAILGCVTRFPAPKNEDDTLAVLAYEFDSSELRDANVLVGSSRTRRVNMPAKQSGSEREYLLATRGSRPLLVAHALPAGRYEIEEIEVDLGTGTGAMTIINLHTPMVFEIRNGFVNNLGLMKFVFTIERTVRIDLVEEFTDVERRFAEYYPVLEWNGFVWIKSGIAWKG